MSVRPQVRRALLVVLTVGALVLAAAGGAALWLRHRMIASLPALDGHFALPGLGAPVTVERDALGTPTITGASRTDIARATGWMHAQDRFFQMDLLRRRGSGELAELFGQPAVNADEEARLHGFRQLAQAVVARARPEQLALLQAYADGVNAGLRALPALPWEYAVMNMAPRPWRPEDTVLINYAMTLDLQESTGRYVRTLAEIRDELGPASVAFFAPLQSPDDAALDDSTGPVPPLPPAREVDLRAAGKAAAVRPGPWADREAPGSNSFAVAGRFAAGGGALVANDMHLRLGVPNIWYRVALRWPGHQVTGVSLPGTPLVVAGSNGAVAWGFTNSNAGTGDIVRVDPSISPTYYHGPGGALKEYEHRHETILVRGGPTVPYEVTATLWGPVVATDPDGRQLVYHWVGDDPAAVNTTLGDLEQARTVREAVDVAHTLGIPAQNFVVGDVHGDIAWTLAGRLPKRVGYDGRLPVSWTYGDRRWDGFLPPPEVPEVVSPPAGRIWSANNRMLGGAALAKLGDSGYVPAARALQIRTDLDQLLARGQPVRPADFLAIQLDDRGLLLARWRDRLRQALAPVAVSGHPARAALLAAAQEWDGRAGAGSVGYGVVRDFRMAVAHRVLDPIFGPCTDRDPDFTWSHLQYEQPVSLLLEQRPQRFLDPAFATWDDLLLAAVDDVAADYAKTHRDARTITWGQINTARIEHPFARFLPAWARGVLSMPADPLAGDANMPRIESPAFGASERFAVSPGHEAEGLFHMPGGASANPCSPYYRAGHEAWVRGDPTPFLPGAAQHTVVLAP